MIDETSPKHNFQDLKETTPKPEEKNKDLPVIQEFKNTLQSFTLDSEMSSLPKDWLENLNTFFSQTDQPNDWFTAIQGKIGMLVTNTETHPSTQELWMDTILKLREQIKRGSWEETRNAFKNIYLVWQTKKERFEQAVQAHLEYIFAFCTQKINEGNNGIILKIDTRSVPDWIIKDLKNKGLNLSPDNEQSGVIKLLKVHQKNSAKREFDTQKKAYDLIDQSPLKKEAAQVPKPYFYKEIAVDEPRQDDEAELKDIKEKVFLQLKKLGFTENEINGKRSIQSEFIVMDYIPGKDLALTMYEWILRHPPQQSQITSEQIDSVIHLGNFDDIQRMAFEVLELPIPMSNQAGLAHENGKKIFKHLQQTGFTVPDTVIKQLKNTAKIFNEGKLNLGDSHERNIIISENTSQEPLAFVIDYGVSFENSERDLNNLITELQTFSDKNNH